jgi:hypothetical protein
MDHPSLFQWSVLGILALMTLCAVTIWVFLNKIKKAISRWFKSELEDVRVAVDKCKKEIRLFRESRSDNHRD